MPKVITCLFVLKNRASFRITRKLFMSGVLLFNLLWVFSLAGFSQSGGWSANYSPQKAFIENQGQFQIPGSTEKVLFAFDGGPNMIYFTEKGISYNFLKSWKEVDGAEEKENERFTNVEEWKEKETKEHRMEYERDAVSMHWENSNEDVQIIGSEPTQDYHSYCITEKDGSIRNVNYIKAFKKITYQNLYPGIDVEYVFHPVEGIKYSLIIHPGADISKISMNYSREPKILENGDIHISTKFGDIIDHAPASFYNDNPSEAIISHFNLDENNVSFSLESTDHSKTIIIDPWTQSPVLPNSNGVWECERDGAGNVYIIGGCMPMKLLKYNAGGILQWTYNTPWDTANNWLGTFATDNAGNSFVTSGSIAALQKINTLGALQWNYTAPIGSSNEYWNIAFNCDQTKLIIGGTSGGLLSLSGAIFDINTSNGSINSTQIVGFGNMFGIPPTIEEVRSITSCRNSRYYFLTLDTIGAIDDNFSICPTTGPTVFRVNHSYGLSYKCENFRPNNGNSGIMSIRANRYFVYTQNGTTIDKRSLIDGSIITSAAIPGGINLTTFGQHQVGNSGIDIDTCGNVYVGSGNGIYKYDANLNLITSVNTPYKVSDVAVSTGGNVVFCGTTGDNSNTNRVGTIQSANMSACPPMTLFCCNSNVCPAGPLCVNDAPITLTPEQAGGVWSGPGVNASTGVFDPSVAGVGTHIITYTLACGSSSINIVVNSCAVLTVCQELNGNLTVSGGTGPYTWQYPHDTVDCSACMIGCIFPPGCSVASTLWITFATGNTATPPASDTIRVIDNNGVIYMITDTSTLQACVPCPAITLASSNITGACTGANNGSFTASSNGGTSPYSYTLLSGATTIATYNNIAGAQNFTGLAPGTYTLNVVDNNSCPGTLVITIPLLPNLTPTISGPTTICAGGSATLNAGAYATYLWSTTSATQTISITAAGTYTVTVTNANGCSGSASINVVLGNNLTPSITGTLQICPGTSTTLDVGSGYANYNWSNSAATQTISVSTAGTYSVTVSDAGGCSGSTSAPVTVIVTLPVTASAVPMSICPGNNVTLTASGGQTYLWNTSPSNTNAVVTVNPVITTTYVVTATYNGCTASASVTVVVDSLLSVNATTTNASCGHDDGTAWVDLAGTGYTYLWNSVPPQFTQTVTGLAAGVYSVTVSYNGCTGVATAIVLKDPGPLAGFYTKPDYPIVDEGPVNFIDQSVGSIMNWLWNFGDSTSANGSDVSHEYADTGSYEVILIVTDMEGCKDTARGIVHIHPQFAFWIPNSFTPNDDDRNEFFLPIGVGIDTKNYLMLIYDRWGREMFSTTDINEGWNGTYQNKYDYNKAVQATYVYLITVKDLNGKSYTYKGIVTLVQ